MVEGEEQVQQSEKVEKLKAIVNINEQTGMDLGRALSPTEQPDDIPSSKAWRHVDEKGRLVKKKLDSVESNSMYWRSKTKQISALIMVCALFFMLIILGSTNKYAEGIWVLMSGAFNTVLGFIFGLFPKF